MKILEDFHLRHGAVLAGRVVQSPMVTRGSTEEGFVTEENIAYYDARSKVAAAIITEASSVSEHGLAFPNGLSFASDEHIEGLTKLAKAIKQNGAKAIAQLHHGGRESRVTLEREGTTYAPSQVNFSFLDHEPTEMTEEQIQSVIIEFGEATRRAIESGFDGVEIHGANHYLLQQFFSAFSNRREDDWGGSLEKRMAFPLAVVAEVKRVIVEANAPADFILGYRISPEEIHGDNIGYSFRESLKLAKELSKYELDYLHISLRGGYASTPIDESEQTSLAELFKEAIGPETALITVSEVFDLNSAEDALNYGDLVAIARAALIEPEFLEKIRQGKAEQIAQAISPQRMPIVKWPNGLIEWLTGENTLPDVPGIETIKK
ncbi:NADH-dependent oxidoreductase [Aerococcaceae bacterium WS4759]|uniref:NADH-dependent oxidoreductase n=1 Tax=Fundicoccus ignavus TaxID=2664442 RepID=A0A6I2GRX3_9LACT|nr:NADH-dependent oxidoreductase [Fundicoccus ignavus]MRI86225.1 NADH-dependent oxidoreductase [Fundicoccus ignavus]